MPPIIGGGQRGPWRIGNGQKVCGGWGCGIRTLRAGSEKLGPDAMTKQFPISARNHGPGITQKRHDRETGGGFLPAVTILPGDAQQIARNILLAGALCPGIRCTQHFGSPRSLLPGHPGVGWNGSRVQQGKKAMKRRQTAKTIDR